MEGIMAYAKVRVEEIDEYLSATHIHENATDRFTLLFRSQDEPNFDKPLTYVIESVASRD
jgi:hypothetical protein